MTRPEPYFPKPHRKPRVDDKGALNGIIFINRNGLRWRDAPKDYGKHRTATSMGVKEGRGRPIGRTQDDMNTKLHTICDSHGRPLDLFVTAGQVSDCIGARALLSTVPDVDWLPGDRGCDADWFKDALKDKEKRACIPGRKQRKTTVKFDRWRYKRRNRIEIMFEKLKTWRRVATRHDRGPMVFLAALALAATVIDWI